MRITVDIHEPDSLYQGLLGLGVQLEKRHLETGDVVIDHEGLFVGIEMKRKSDFDNSLHSGRLHDQVCRLYENYTYPILLIESWDGEDVDRHLQQVETLNLRIATYKTRGERETVEFIDKIIRLIKQKKLIIMKRPVIVEDDIDLRIQVLSSLPNINKARAAEILAKYQCLEDAFAHVDSWIEITGITEERLAIIRKIWLHIGTWSYSEVLNDRFRRRMLHRR